MTAKTKDELIEALAEIEHIRWADWQRWVHSKAYQPPEAGGGLLLSGVDVRRWEGQIATSYDALSEEEKQSDREQVIRYWPLIVDFVAEWIDDNTGFVWGYGGITRRWREQMQADDEGWQVCSRCNRAAPESQTCADYFPGEGWVYYCLACFRAIAEKETA